MYQNLLELELFSPLLDPYLSLHDHHQILSIRARAILFGAFCQGFFIYPPIDIGDFFGHGDMDTCHGLNGADKNGCVIQGVHSPCVKPGIPAAQGDYIELTFFQINFIQIRDFQFSPGRRPDSLGVFTNILIIEIKSGDCIVGLQIP